MGSTIVTKPSRTSTQKQHPISKVTRELAMGNGLSVAHEILSCLRDIGENYAKSALSTETMRSTVIDFAKNAADGCSLGAERIEAEQQARGEAEKAAETIKRLHEFFYKDEGAHLQAMEPDVIGNLILGMVKPAGIHLERAIRILGHDGAGFDSFTSEFGETAAIPSEPVNQHVAVKAANEYRAAAEAITKAHGALFALKDLGENLDQWQSSFITLGQTLRPLTAELDAQLGKVEDLLPSPTEPSETATTEILKAMEYTEALAFMAKHLIYGEGASYDDPKAFDDDDVESGTEFWSDFTRDRLLSCFGASIVGMVHRIAHHTDRAIEALGERHLVISL